MELRKWVVEGVMVGVDGRAVVVVGFKVERRLGNSVGIAMVGISVA
jgi:hypothetical protein